MALRVELLNHCTSSPSKYAPQRSSESRSYGTLGKDAQTALKVKLFICRLLLRDRYPGEWELPECILTCSLCTFPSLSTHVHGSIMWWTNLLCSVQISQQKQDHESSWEPMGKTRLRTQLCSKESKRTVLGALQWTSTVGGKHM